MLSHFKIRKTLLGHSRRLYVILVFFAFFFFIFFCLILLATVVIFKILRLPGQHLSTVFAHSLTRERCVFLTRGGLRLEQEWSKTEAEVV